CHVSATSAAGTSTGAEETFTTLPNPHTVTTGAAASVSQTQATLKASVNPNGSSVSECKLEYGTSPSYGSSAPCKPSPGSGANAVEVSAAISGLLANTSYHFRVVATNAGGTSTGADETFTTPPNPPTVITGAPSAVSQTQATLSGSVKPNGAGVSECKLEYGTSTSYTESAPCAPAPGSSTSAVAVSAAISALTANTTYHFRVSAPNAGGTTTGADETFTTLPNPPT